MSVRQSKPSYPPPPVAREVPTAPPQEANGPCSSTSRVISATSRGPSPTTWARSSPRVRPRSWRSSCSTTAPRAPRATCCRSAKRPHRPSLSSSSAHRQRVVAVAGRVPALGAVGRSGATHRARAHGAQRARLGRWRGRSAPLARVQRLSRRLGRQPPRRRGARRGDPRGARRAGARADRSARGRHVPPAVPGARVRARRASAGAALVTDARARERLGLHAPARGVRRTAAQRLAGHLRAEPDARPGAGRDVPRGRGRGAVLGLGARPAPARRRGARVRHALHQHAAGAGRRADLGGAALDDVALRRRRAAQEAPPVLRLRQPVRAVPGVDGRDGRRGRTGLARHHAAARVGADLRALPRESRAPPEAAARHVHGPRAHAALGGSCARPRLRATGQAAACKRSARASARGSRCSSPARSTEPTSRRRARSHVRATRSSTRRSAPCSAGCRRSASSTTSKLKESVSTAHRLAEQARKAAEMLLGDGAPQLELAGQPQRKREQREGFVIAAANTSGVDRGWPRWSGVSLYRRRRSTS